MQQLHLVGFTTDHKGLILGTRRGTQEGSFVVTLDRALVEQIEELLRIQAGDGGSGDSAAAGNGTSPGLRRPKTESRLSPREVQSMLRTGRSVSEVAEAAAMSEDWVGRFAPPVLAEQARVVDRATGLTYSKPRIGPSIQPLGESVVWNLAERGVILSGPAVDDAWSAFQQPDGIWVVRVSYLAERRRQHADWTVDMANGALKAINRLGNELGYVEPGRRRPQALPPATPVSVSAQRAAAVPPKMAPPPPLPPRPTGRLSLLGASAGVTRQRSSSGPASVVGRNPRPTATPGRETPEDGGPGEATSAPPAPPTAPPARERRQRPLRPLSASTSTEDVAAPPAGTGPRTAEAASDSADEGDTSAKPRPRRERPLRAPSRIRRDELAGPPPPPPPPATRRASVPPAAVPPRRSTPNPRGNDASSPPPRPSGPSASSEPVVNRFAPAHSVAERRISTAERFGIGRSGQTALASQPTPVSRPAPVSQPSPVRRSSTLAVATMPDPQPEVDTASEPGADDHAERVMDRRGARPLRARRISLEPDQDPDQDPDHEADLEADPAFAPAPASRRGRTPDADEVYQAFADLGADDPVTAPVPALDFADPGGYYDEGQGLDNGEYADDGVSGGQDQVLIRTGQAGAADPAGSGAPRKARPASDDRQARPGRLKLRRRPQDSP
ncbi:MAG: hypothetical protein QOE57_716 [Acidimicrobiaceae bacterium]|nr:hypothetical protein [Acidimicrobiaceae bacterium]